MGITEAGSREYGTLKSAAGIGAILLRGIGDTIRVSLLGDPVPEIDAGFDILRACDRRVTKPEVVACPTCGRLDIDLERIVAEVEDKMKGMSNPLRISILGCLVNGFGEAKEADLGIAAGSGKGIIFSGVPIRHVKEAEMVQALLEEVERFGEETKPLASFVEKERQKQQKWPCHAWDETARVSFRLRVCSVSPDPAVSVGEIPARTQARRPGAAIFQECSPPSSPGDFRSFDPVARSSPGFARRHCSRIRPGPEPATGPASPTS